MNSVHRLYLDVYLLTYVYIHIFISIYKIICEVNIYLNEIWSKSIYYFLCLNLINTRHPKDGAVYFEVFFFIKKIV